MDDNYNIPDKPEYNLDIKKLQDDDWASATQTFNPLFEQMIENTAAVKMQSEKSIVKLEETIEKLELNIDGLDGTKGMPGGLASLDEEGRIFAEQLPDLNYDSAGSAEVVQNNLSRHEADNELHVTTDKQFSWDVGAKTAAEAKLEAETAQFAAAQAQATAYKHKDDEKNPHNVSTAQIGAIPTAQKGVTGGIATLGSDGKVPPMQLPEMDFDIKGAAASVQSNLNTHKLDENLHVTSEKQSQWNIGALTAGEAKEAAANAQSAADAAQKAADTANEAIQRKLPEVVEIKSSTTYIVPKGVHSIDAYLLGGGDGGIVGNSTGSNTNIGTGGLGGFGGRILHVTGISVIPGQKIKALVGAGGEGTAPNSDIGIHLGGDTEFGILSTALSSQYDINKYSQEIIEGMIYRTSLPRTTMFARNGSSSFDTINIVNGLNICPINNNVYGIAGVSGGASNINNSSSGIAGCGIRMTIGGIVINRSGGAPSGSRGGSGGGGASVDADGGDVIDGESGRGANANLNTGNGGGGGGGRLGASATGRGGNGGSGIIVLRLYYQ